VKLSVLSKTGREAVVAMLGPGDFFGEGCLAGQPVCMGSATAITGSTILFVDKDEMVRLLHQQHALSDRFIAHILARNTRIEEDLVDPAYGLPSGLARRGLGTYSTIRSHVVRTTNRRRSRGSDIGASVLPSVSSKSASHAFSVGKTARKVSSGESFFTVGGTLDPRIVPMCSVFPKTGLVHPLALTLP